MKQQLLVKRENEFSYPIVFCRDFSDLAGCIQELYPDRRSACVITDSNVAPLYLNEVLEALSAVCGKVVSYVIPAGEENKHLTTVADIYRYLIREGLDRKSFLAALGGGVTGDITGFAAATYLRGIDFVQIPTTLLSQVDSSVGGKTGVDVDQFKNMVGAFHQPRLVYMNLSTLSTLPEEEFICGMGEIIKTGLICDEEFFRYCEGASGRIRRLEPDAVLHLVSTCCEIKAGVVERDPKEKGERALLNLGHTIGHAVEKKMNFTLKHGQCVGLGLLSAARISVNKGTLTEEEFGRIRKVCREYGLPEKVQGLTEEEILEASRKDKKMDRGQIRFILMRGLGHAYMDTSLTADELRAGIREILV
ncbi:MAG: 3-dehydroquinate synthase [Blautia sp.]|nr:3-dehydroquinate synthase [Blautia sp.]